MTIRFVSVCLCLASALPTAAASEQDLQRRLEALVQQTQRRYEHHAPSLESRLLAIEATISSWNEVAENPGASNAELLSDWLDASIRAVMPRGSGVLPPSPEFRPMIATVVAPPALLVPEEEVVPVVTAPETPQLIEPQASAARTPPAVASPQGGGGGSRPSWDVAPPRSQFVGPRASRQVVSKPVSPPAAPAPSPEVRVTPARSKWSQHPSAAPLDWRDPFADSPSASPNPLRSGARHETLRPRFTSGRARIDYQQLAADVRGYNAALRSLHTMLLKTATGDIAVLAAATEELMQLREQKAFLDLYRKGLSPNELAAIPESPSIDLVQELVRRKVHALAEQRDSQDAGEKQLLKQLRDRLASGDDAGSSY